MMEKEFHVGQFLEQLNVYLKLIIDNMTTLFLIAASTAGFIICKRNKIPHFPFSVAFGLTCFINLFHHV